MDNPDYFIGVAQQALWILALACAVAGAVLVVLSATGTGV